MGVPLAAILKVKAAPAVAGAELALVITGVTTVATPLTVKLCRSIFDSKVPDCPACVACSVTRPGAVGVTVKTPPTGRLIETEPIDPETNVSAIGKAELAEGVTVNEPALIARSAMAAKLTDCHVALTAPVV